MTEQLNLGSNALDLLLRTDPSQGRNFTGSESKQALGTNRALK